MFERIVAYMANLIINLISRAISRPIKKVETEDVARVDLERLIDWTRAIIYKGLGVLDKEISNSRFASASLRALGKAGSLTPSFPFKLNLPFLKDQHAKSLISPLIFIVGFIAFMGLSDHGISAFALWSIVASLGAYFIGTRLARMRFRSIPGKYDPLLLLALAACVIGYFLVGETASKIGLVPLFLLILSNRHGGRISICALFAGYLLFRQGNMSVGFPYALIGTLGVARNLRTEKLALLLERNAYTISIMLMLVGVLYWVLDIALVGRIPLFTTREGLDPTYTMRSHLLPIGSILMISLLGEWGKRTGNAGKARTASILLILFSALLMALLGYRTQVLITLVASIIVAIIWDLITVTELFAAGSLVVVAFAFMTVMRTYTTGANVGFLESVYLRSGLTLDIYDMMANLGGYMGFTKGQTLVASISSFASLMPGIAYSPRRYIAVFAGGSGISMTSTILGPFALDFGLVGTIIIIGAFGYFIQKERSLIWGTTGKRKSIMSTMYGLTLGYMLIGIETGLVDYEVLMLFAFAFLYSIYLSHLHKVK